MSLETEIVDMKSAAMLYNIMWCLILVFCFALFLPIQHLAKSFQRFPEFWTTHQEEGVKEYYVRKPILEPRRETTDMNTMNDVLECRAVCSYVNKKQIGKKKSKCVRKKRFANYKGHLNNIIEMPNIDI